MFGDGDLVLVLYMAILGGSGNHDCLSDLTPCDFFSIRYVKSTVNQHHPSTLETLRYIITQDVEVTISDMTRW